MEVLDRVKQQMLDYVRQQKQNGSYFFLETAGGIHSPVMSGKKNVFFGVLNHFIKRQFY